MDELKIKVRGIRFCPDCGIDFYENPWAAKNPAPGRLPPYCENCKTIKELMLKSAKTILN